MLKIKHSYARITEKNTSWRQRGLEHASGKLPTSFKYPLIAIQLIRLGCAAQNLLKHTFHFQQDHRNKVTTLRHLLSADTRDERVNWCSVISRSLASLRAWDPTSSRPLR